MRESLVWKSKWERTHEENFQVVGMSVIGTQERTVTVVGATYGFLFFCQVCEQQMFLRDSLVM